MNELLNKVHDIVENVFEASNLHADIAHFYVIEEKVKTMYNEVFDFIIEHFGELRCGDNSLQDSIFYCHRGSYTFNNSEEATKLLNSYVVPIALTPKSIDLIIVDSSKVFQHYDVVLKLSIHSKKDNLYFMLTDYKGLHCKYEYTHAEMSDMYVKILESVVVGTNINKLCYYCVNAEKRDSAVETMLERFKENHASLRGTIESLMNTN